MKDIAEHLSCIMSVEKFLEEEMSHWKMFDESVQYFFALI